MSLTALLEITGLKNWYLEFEGQGLELTELMSDTIGTVEGLRFATRANGLRSDSGIVGSVNVSELSGSYRNSSFKIAGLGRITPGRFVFDSVWAAVLGGEVNAVGSLSWTPALDWNANVTAQGLNPASLMPDSADWNGSLSATVQMAGLHQSDGYSAQILVDTVSGVLRGEEVAAKLSGRKVGDLYAIDSLTAGWGNMSLFARGEAGERVFGRLELQAPNVGIVAPGVAGSVRAELEIDGPRDAPTIAGSFAGSGLRYRSVGADTIVAGGMLDFSTEGQFDFSATVANLQMPARTVDSIGVDLSGTSGNHAIEVTAAGGPSSIGVSHSSVLTTQSKWRSRLT